MDLKLVLPDRSIYKLRGVDSSEASDKCMTFANEKNVSVQRLEYLDEDGDMVTISSNNDLQMAYNENNQKCLKVNIVQKITLDSKPENAESPKAKRLKSNEECIGEASSIKTDSVELERFRQETTKLSKWHEDTYGVKCDFSCDKKSGLIKIECPRCHTWMKAGDLHKRLQSVRVHCESLAHKNSIYETNDRTQIDSECVADVEIRTETSKRIVRETANKEFILLSKSCKCRYCGTEISYIPKHGSFKENLDSHLCSSGHIKNVNSGFRQIDLLSFCKSNKDCC